MTFREKTGNNEEGKKIRFKSDIFHMSTKLKKATRPQLQGFISDCICIALLGTNNPPTYYMAHTQISPSLKCFTPRLGLHPQVLTAPSKNLLDIWISLHCYVTHVHNHTQTDGRLTHSRTVVFICLFHIFLSVSGASSQGRRLCEGMRSLQSAWVYF